MKRKQSGDKRIKTAGRPAGTAAYAYRNAEIPERGPAYDNAPGAKAKKKRRVNFGMIALALSAVLLGGFLGSTLYKLIPRAAPLNFDEFWEYSEAEYLANHTVENPYTSVSEVTDSYELWRICYSNLLSAPYVRATTEGYTKASGVTQSIDNVKKYDAAKKYMYACSISSGFVTVKERYYYDLAADSISVQIGDNSPAAGVGIGYFLPVYGNSIRGFLNYDVAENTVKERGPIAADGENYTFTLTFDPLPATDRYTRQVYHMAGGASPMPENKKPVYESVSVTWTVSADFKILKVYVAEKYKIFTPMKTTCTAEMTEIYDYSAFSFEAGETL